MKYGYVRVSTDKQDLDMQISAMRKVGLSDDVIFRDVISGKVTSRDGLDGMLEKLKKGDTLYVWKLDRLGRTVVQLAVLIDSFVKKGVSFVSLTEGFDITTPLGKMMAHMVSIVAEMERNNTSERTRAKLQFLKSQGIILGRPKKYAGSYPYVMKLFAEGLSAREISNLTGISKSQVNHIRNHN